MIDRRHFLSAAGTGLTAAQYSATTAQAKTTHPEKKQRKKIALVATIWFEGSHTWHMAQRFLSGYPKQGRWHDPEIELVSAYVAQKPASDLSRSRSAEFGFPIYDSIPETLRNGGDKLAVDGVLLIGEHGNYPKNELGQTLYPRYEFFKQITDVFREEKRSVPVFNDKHLSWKFAWAKEMVQISEELKFPFLAGSSLPVTWRMPSVEMPYGAEIEEAICVASGPLDHYDFHALETLQCMLERRKGGETGVVAVQAIKGEAVWRAMQTGSFAKGGWNPELFSACLCRSQTLQQGKTHNHRYPTFARMQEMVKEPIAYRIEYADGLKATMFLMNGLVTDFTFAAKLKNRSEPLSTLFYLNDVPNVVHFAQLMSHFERMVVSGKAPYPVERTLLTSGILEANIKSLAAGGSG